MLYSAVTRPPASYADGRCRLGINVEFRGQSTYNLVCGWAKLVCWTQILAAIDNVRFKI